MSDLLVKDGTVVDGTGAPGRRADVRVRGGVIAEVAPDLAPAGEPIVDAGGATVAPGFIDTHTHLDPSMFWDPACDPMPQHGVTTALVGNCSLSLAPVRPEHLDEVMDVFCYIEDMPIDDFRSGIPWSWKTWREYRDAMNRCGASLNMASLIGHSMLRIYVMGPDAWTRAARPEEIEAMCAELRDALAGGCYGLSTSFFDVDRRGRFVPSRLAEPEEFAALAQTMADAGYGVLEFIPNFTGEDPQGEMRLIADAFGSRGVTSIWNGLLHTEMAPERSGDLIAFNRELRAGGADIWPIASPRTVDFAVNWEQTMVFMMLPLGWNRIMLVQGDERAALLRDAEWRRVAREEWDSVDKSLFPEHPHPPRALHVGHARGERALARREPRGPRGRARRTPERRIRGLDPRERSRAGRGRDGREQQRRRGRGRDAHRRRGDRECERCRGARADDVCGGGHDAAADPPRARAR